MPVEKVYNYMFFEKVLLQLKKGESSFLKIISSFFRYIIIRFFAHNRHYERLNRKNKTFGIPFAFI